jgi:HemK-related putative methylase
VNNFSDVRDSLQRHVIQGVQIGLSVPSDVFEPSASTIGLAQHIRVEPGESVADIGTGSGIMAILAAKLGAAVSATDISDSAIAAARANADVNGVAIDLRQGDLFGDLNGRFDVIIANLPQARLEPDTLRSLNPGLRVAIDGGAHGNAVLLRFLRTCCGHMHGQTRLYVSVDTETDYLATLSEMLENFEVRLLGVYTHALYDVINEMADSYRRLNERGEVCVFTKNGRLHGLQFVVELTVRTAGRS